MQAVLLVLHLIIAFSIIVIVMIQPSETGGFLGSSGSMSNLSAPRRSGDILSRITTILAICFFATSLLLAIAAGNRPTQKSILDAAPAEQPAAEQPAAEKQAAAPAAPAAAEPSAVDKLKADAAKAGNDNAPAADKKAPTKPKKPSTPKAPISQ